MEQHADGRPKCVACGLCPTVCPANCIRLVGGEDDQGNRYPIVYEIDEFRCIFCGMCQEVCPVEAIHVGRHFENAEYTRDRFVYDLDRLMEQDHPSTLLWDPSDRVLSSGTRPFLHVRRTCDWRRDWCRNGKSPIGSLLFMVTTLGAMAGTFVLLEAHFLAAIQIIVYAGAIMVLFLFVIMLLNLGHDYQKDLKGGAFAVMSFGVTGVIAGFLARNLAPLGSRTDREGRRSMH